MDSENADFVLSRTGFVICYANCDLNGIPWKHMWLYHGGVGMLSYLANSFWPET